MCKSCGVAYSFAFSTQFHRSDCPEVRPICRTCYEPVAEAGRRECLRHSPNAYASLDRSTETLLAQHEAAQQASESIRVR